MIAGLDKIKSFEKCLDIELDTLEIMSYDRFESIEAVGVIHEIALHDLRLIWGGAIDVLIPKLLVDSKGTKRGLPAEAAISALQFAQNYYFLRDYFYFTYNVPGTMQWDFSEKDVTIKLLDQTFQLQKFLEINHWFMSSKEAFSGFEEVENETKKYVEQTSQEFVELDTLNLAFEGCIKEAELKLETYPNFLTDDFVFDSYSLGQFRAVYKHLLARALLRRYFVQKYLRNKVEKHGWILAPRKHDLVKALAEESGVPNSIVEEILSDLTLDIQKAKKGQGVTSFPLIYNPDEEYYLLFPNCICLCECFDSLRKAWALRNQKLYGKKVANVVGEEMAKRIEDIFRKNGFSYVKRNISLRQFGERLPDIDVLSIWEEPGFGYVVFLCETKNTIPEKFGKDFIRSISSTGFITEAQKQINDICKALGGQNFYELLKKSFPGTKLGFGTYALYSLIITSQNNGVFSAGKTIVDCNTFEKIVTSSKGDILYVLSRMKQEELMKACKKCSTIINQKAQIGPFVVTFPAIGISALLQI